MSDKSTHPWVEPTHKNVKDSVHSLHHGDIDYKKTHQSYKEGTVERIPHHYFTSDKHFEKFTKHELKSKDLDSRVKHIVHGFKHGKMPMILGVKRRGKTHIVDGFTRAGVAIALGHPIYAKVAHVKNMKEDYSSAAPTTAPNTSLGIKAGPVFIGKKQKGGKQGSQASPSDAQVIMAGDYMGRVKRILNRMMVEKWKK